MLGTVHYWVLLFVALITHGEVKVAQLIGEGRIDTSQTVLEVAITLAVQSESNKEHASSTVHLQYDVFSYLVK